MTGMRLYLSSYQLGDHPELLGTLVTGGRRGWVIMNALDGLDEQRRQADVVTQILALRSIGLEARDFDLRDYSPSAIRTDFGEPDFVWVRGGNVFTLRAAMARSGLDEIIVQQIWDDALVYAGFSAGPCVLSPSLAGFELCDPTEVCASTYGMVRFDGLGILDRQFVPHLNSPDHPESAILGEVATRYESAGIPYWALRDGQALVIDGPTATIVG